MSIWIITGATRGLGHALAEQLLNSGHAVSFCARHAEDVASTARQLSTRGPVYGLAGSIADSEFVTQWVDHTVTQFGQIDGLILNAATLGDPPLSAVAVLNHRDLEKTGTINVMGNLLMLQACHPYLTRSANPRVLVMTSDAAWAAYPGWASYGASKAFLELLVSTYAAENPTISVHLIDPGDMDTRMHHLALPKDTASLRDPRAVAMALTPLWQMVTSASRRWTVASNSEHQLFLREVDRVGSPISY